MLEDNSRMFSRILEAARRKLLETGTRNRLIHVNRANQRTNCLNLINERSDDLFRLLRTQEKRMRFRATGRDRNEGEQDILLAAPLPDPSGISERQVDSYIDTPLGPEGLARRLLRLAHDARIAEEEQGLNILYLAMGFLRWRESKTSEVQREAPLILIPVSLVRNTRTSTYDIQSRDDDITTNLPLQERLRQDFGIVLPEVEESDDWSPSQYFARVSEAISTQPGWSVDANGMQLGFFSFAKLLMHHDLDPAKWPAATLAGNPLLSGLLADGFEADTPMFGPQDRLDDHLDPAQIIQVVDADASQTKVIEEVRGGASLVVQGPPGTGKSQTITNIIAAAAHDGKSVLFVAEKMAALSVVHDRLVKAGLRDICIELHSRTANKKALSQELGRTLMASARPLPGVADPARLRVTRDDLNRITALLHTPLAPSHESPFHALSEIIGFISAGAKPPSIPAEGLEALDREARERALAAVLDLTEAIQVAGTPAEHPFRGAQALDLQPTDLARLENELGTAVSAIATLRDTAGQIARATHQPVPVTLTDVSRLGDVLKALSGAPAGASELVPALFSNAGLPRQSEALRVGADWAEAQAAAAGTFSTPAWTASLGPMRQGIACGQRSWFARIFGPYRRASGELASLLIGRLPKGPAERLALADQLAEVQNRRARLAEEESWLQSALGAEWRGERTPFAVLLAVSDWLGAVKQAGAFSEAGHVTAALAAVPDLPGAAADLDASLQACRTDIAAPVTRLRLDLAQAGFGDTVERAPLAALAEFFAEMASDGVRYSEWTRLARGIAASLENGAGSIIGELLTGRIDSDDAVREFSYACAEARWNAARAARPELTRLSGINRHQLVGMFQMLEKERIEATKNLILARHFEQIPRGTMGEMGIIRGEIGRKRGHKPIRWLMKNSGGMIQRIKPVMLMSPISVAQFLPPDSVTFDLLVIDEASQIRPEDALGAIARARQIVVVGDQKQLPPTSFFDRLVDDADDNEDEDEEDAPVGATAADMESILSLCEARGLRARMLEWHYRSRDPSLIQVSNAEFYGDNLVLPPSPLQLDEDYGLKFHRVPGVYARGGSGLGRQGTNRIEATAIVKAMADHARNWPDLSLGVVAFSKAQADMLTEVLELERRRDPALEMLLREGGNEDVFVKNIENVQGDERDVIMISVGYGPQEANGQLRSMSFGPVNGEGGERRLNVLFSRARVRCEVFASFDPGDIDPGRTKRDGPRVLKRFLDFAKTGTIEQHEVTGRDPDSPFEEDVAAVIRSLGYLADPQVGTTGFRIDLGVRHPERPGQYLLAVECDGAAYHAALWARERDRLRQAVLENLGWCFHRIWSTDWFHHRDREVRRLTAALAQSRETKAEGLRVRGANSADRRPPPVEEPSAQQDIDIGHIVLTAPAYVRAILAVPANREPHEVPTGQLAELVARVIDIEGPIHRDEVARRITSAFGLSRAGNRIVDATHRAIALAQQRNPALLQDGDFFLMEEQAKAPPVRNRSAESGAILKAACLPPMEIAAAARRIRLDSGDISRDDLIRAVARLLGFQRIGSDLAEVLNQHVE
jgi:hypothetical protein